VRHRPALGYTSQINNPALLAERTGIAVVADFRSRDVAAGGQGAPLVAAFHRALFGTAGETRAVLNLGGISNLTALLADGRTTGFDCGPANVLMDLWSLRHTGQRFDADGAWAASGSIQPLLLDVLLQEPYFAQAPPKSTGRDLFNADWLDNCLRRQGQSGRAEDVQTTLCELTAVTCAQAILAHAGDATELLVCGGGALNKQLMRRLAHHLPGMAVRLTDDRGLPAQHVEAAAFAWLAYRHLHGEPGNLSSVTGAAGPRVLGALDGEARTTPARGRGVRVLDHELSALQVVLVIDLGACQVLQAHRVDQQRDAVLVHLRVVFVDDFIKGETVLEARATATLHKHPQLQLGVAFFINQLFDLARRAVGEDQRHRRHLGLRGLNIVCNCAHGKSFRRMAGLSIPPRNLTRRWKQPT
jgi:anhydro-N-acetylmuramic acid kinase